MKTSTCLKALAIAAGGLVLSQPAYAQTATGNLEVLANIDPACTVSTNPVDFGTFDPTTNFAGVFATGAVNVRCTVDTAWTASAGLGENQLAVGSTSVRRMASQTLATPAYAVYHLFTDAARTTVFHGPGVYSGVGTGLAQINTVYGGIASNQFTLPVDSYRDTVLITVTY